MIKRDSRDGQYEVARKTESLSLKTDSIEKHLTKKDFVRVYQFFKLPKVKMLSTVYFLDNVELSARKRIKGHLWMPTSGAKDQTQLFRR